MSEISLKEAWKWANGEIGLGLFVPQDVDEKDVELMVELQKRVRKNVKIWMTDTSRHSKPIFGQSDMILNAYEVMAQCPTTGCNKRFRLTLKSRDDYCPKCGQALSWDVLDSYKEKNNA